MVEGFTFERPWLLLCEGRADKYFLEEIIGHFDIHKDKIDVRFPARDENDSGGNSKFAPFIALNNRTSISFRTNVKYVVVICDKDNDGDQSFIDLRTKLLENSLPAPRVTNEVKKKEGFPSIVVHMIPNGPRGSLETIWLEAAYRKYGQYNLKDALDEYVSRTPANAWELPKQEKMRAQSIVAAVCEKRPNSSFANHWQKQICVDPADPAFSPVVTFLKGLERILI